MNNRDDQSGKQHDSLDPPALERSDTSGTPDGPNAPEDLNTLDASDASDTLHTSIGGSHAASTGFTGPPPDPVPVPASASASASAEHRQVGQPNDGQSTQSTVAAISPDAAPIPDSRWLLVGELPCLGCTYNLRGLVGPDVRCPECGQLNDLRLPELWRVKTLPLGVRIREHWPMLATFLSILPIVGLLLGGWCGVSLLALPWLWVCGRWLWVSTDLLWGMGALAAVHLLGWGLLCSAASFVWICINPGAAAVWAWPTLPAIAAGSVVCLFRVRRMLRLADGSDRFRNDWQSWQGPRGTVPIASPTTAEPGEEPRTK